MSNYSEYSTRLCKITHENSDQRNVMNRTRIKEEAVDDEKSTPSKTLRRVFSRSAADTILAHLDIKPSLDSSYEATPIKRKFSKRQFDEATSSDRSLSNTLRGNSDFSDKQFRVPRSVAIIDSEDDYTPKKCKRENGNTSFNYSNSFDESPNYQHRTKNDKFSSRDKDCSDSDDFSKRRSGFDYEKFEKGDKARFLSPLSKSFNSGCSTQSQRSDKHHRRFSERFSKDRSFFNKRHSIGDPMNRSARNRGRFFSGESFFQNEFKSTNFIERLDKQLLEQARNTLQTEIDCDIPFVDTHCHFDFLFKRLDFKETVDKYWEQTFFKFPSNFEGCIADWCQPSLYSDAARFLKAGSKKFKLWAAFGCHPHFVQDYNEVVEKTIECYIDSYDNVIAWGEMGLDYSDRFGQTDHEKQKRVFVRQLERARRRNLPLVIHCRDADPDLIDIMKTYVPHDTKIHRHCLTTEEKDVRDLLDYFPNCYVGFTNLLTNRSAYRPRDAASKIPLERILLETDAPYFIPRCITAASKGAARWSHPGMASSVACELAYIKGIEVSGVLETIRDNVYSLYGI